MVLILSSLLRATTLFLVFRGCFDAHIGKAATDVFLLLISILRLILNIVVVS